VRGVHSVVEILAGGDAPIPVEPNIEEVATAAEFHVSAFTDD